jgi:hypothetical protein
MRAHLVAVVWSINVLASCLAGAAAADSIEDPKQACEALALVIGEADADQLTRSMLSDSRGGMSREASTAGAEQIAAFAKLQGRFRLAEFMAEREFGQRVKRYWYLVLFESGQPFYVACLFIKPDNGWQLVDIKFNTDFDKVPIP